MPDPLNPTQRSYCMSQVRSRNTKPEMFIRSKLHKMGYRFRIHVKSLPGKPDIVLKKYKTVVFVNGCFWHGHSCKKGKLPSTNVDFWKDKIEKNIHRDATNERNLKKIGWNVVIIWECNLENGLSMLVQKLDAAIEKI